MIMHVLYALFVFVYFNVESLCYIVCRYLCTCIYMYSIAK